MIPFNCIQFSKAFSHIIEKEILYWRIFNQSIFSALVITLTSVVGYYLFTIISIFFFFFFLYRRSSVIMSWSTHVLFWTIGPLSVGSLQRPIFVAAMPGTRTPAGAI